MRAILHNLWRRENYLFLIFIGLGMMLTLVFASNLGGTTSIPAYADHSVSGAEREQWMAVLNQGEEFRFLLVSEAQARADIREGRAEVAVRLSEAGEYRLSAAAEHASVMLVDRYVQQQLNEHRQLQAAGELVSDTDALHAGVRQALDTPVLTMERLTIAGEPRVKNTMQIQLLFAFTLFFAILTIALKVNVMLEDRNAGVWNRMILSRVSKSQMYLGYLIYSFGIGVVQIMLMLLVMQFGFGMDIGYRYHLILSVVALFVLTIVSLAMLLVGLIRSAETNGSVISMLAPAMPLLSGAYFPISGPFMTAVAELMPLTHALDALKGIVLFDYGWTDLAAPSAKLVIMIVLFMGVGINLIERRRLA